MVPDTPTAPAAAPRIPEPVGAHQTNDSDALCCNGYRSSCLRRGVTSRCPTNDTDPAARCNRSVLRRQLVIQSPQKRYLFAPRWCLPVVSLRLRNRPDLATSEESHPPDETSHASQSHMAVTAIARPVGTVDSQPPRQSTPSATPPPRTTPPATTAGPTPAVTIHTGPGTPSPPPSRVGAWPPSHQGGCATPSFDTPRHPH